MRLGKAKTLKTSFEAYHSFDGLLIDFFFTGFIVRVNELFDPRLKEKKQRKKLIQLVNCGG